MSETKPNDFAFRLDGDRIRLVTPEWSRLHRIDRATADRLMAELTACLGVPGSAAWHDAPTCAGWWWNNSTERWSRWLQWDGGFISGVKGPWWGPWTAPKPPASGPVK